MAKDQATTNANDIRVGNNFFQYSPVIQTHGDVKMVLTQATDFGLSEFTALDLRDGWDKRSLITYVLNDYGFWNVSKVQGVNDATE